MNQSVIVESKERAIWLRLNRPQASNAINDEMRSALWAALAEIESNRELRALVITGEGKAFAAGSDVRELAALTPAESVALSERIAAFHHRLARLPIPVIAAVNGWCLGGGFELALACDLRVASEKARFGLPEPSLGLVSGGGGIPRLARLVGPGIAGHLCLSAEIVDAETALSYGIVSKVVAPDALHDYVRELTGKIATLAPLAVAQAKRVLSAGAADLEAAVALEAQACALCVATEDWKEGAAAFLDKRPSAFVGR